MTGAARGRLLTCDLICYGAASPAVFQDYLALLERGRGRRLASYSHRGDGIETRGCEVARFCDGSVERGTARTRLWSRLWYGYLLRASCLSCGHHSLDRPGDLTIGDFWGLERVTQVADDGWGVSCVLANDAEGLALLRGAAGRLELVESAPLDVANEAQPMLSHPPKERPDRAAFWETLRASGLDRACRQLGLLGVRASIGDAIRGLKARLRPGGITPPAEAQDGWAACPKVDPAFISEGHGKGGLPVAFASRNRSERVRRMSSSGGVFHALASHVIEDLGGVVYGCAFDEGLRAVHVRCETMGQAERCMGSKYTQSDVGDALAQVIDDLDAGLTVLFTGLPCQVAAVRALSRARAATRPATRGEPSVAGAAAGRTGLVAPDNAQYRYRDGSALDDAAGRRPHSSTRFRDLDGARDAAGRHQVPSRLPELYEDRSQCCGCAACATACPHGAIGMEPDEEGFAYPVVRASLCSGCSACMRACAFKGRVLPRDSTR